MDVRTLFLAQTLALVTSAAMLWAARAQADLRNGLRTWTFSISFQGLAYLLLANAGRLPTLLSGGLGNALGALSVAGFYVAIRQFLGLPFSRAWLAAMCLAVTLIGFIAGADYAGATIFNGVVYGWLQLLNARALWRVDRPGLLRVQRLVALFYLLMGLVLPLRAAGLLLAGGQLHYLDMPLSWQAPIYAFGFVYVIATNLGFLQMCKMRAEAEVREQALTDGLTGLGNRRALDEAMARSMAAAQRQGRPFAVLMADLDRFKAINDRFGHHVGDQALVSFARRLHAGLRSQDQAFRYGGEEFSVLLPDTDASGVMALAERLRALVARPGTGSEPAITASFGIAVWRAGDTADALFDRADRALYRAKQAGRDRVELG